MQSKKESQFIKRKRRGKKRKWVHEKINEEERGGEGQSIDSIEKRAYNNTRNKSMAVSLQSGFPVETAFHCVARSLTHSLFLSCDTERLALSLFVSSARRQLASNLLHLSGEDLTHLSCAFAVYEITSHRVKRQRESEREKKSAIHLKRETAKRDQIKTQAIRQNEESRREKRGTREATREREKLERGLQWATVK